MSVNTTQDALYKAAWKMCCELRGSMDSSEMKNYIFAMMFYRYISETFSKWINESEWELGNKDFDYATFDDKQAEQLREDSAKKKGFFILPSQLFGNLLKRAREDEEIKKGINEHLGEIFASIENSASASNKPEHMKRLLSIKLENVNLGEQTMDRNLRIYKIMSSIENLNIDICTDRNSKQQYEDIMGNLYEYLMGMYASAAGKKGGEFYTPAKVSELLTRLVTAGKTHIRRAYDPTCGSGSLLLKFIKVLGYDNVSELYGQEYSPTTYNLCRMNMLIHNVNYDKFDIRNGDTLSDPKHREMKFDAIVSNPPYSQLWCKEGGDKERFLRDPRFEPPGALAPPSKADFSFILHCLYHLNEDGKAAIICSTGVLNREIGGEKIIRKWLIKQNYVETVILLPGNLFFGTGITTAIIVLSKCKKDNQILFIDASQQFEKVKKNNVLNDEHISWILDLYRKRGDEQFFSKLATMQEIENFDYDLWVKKYIEQPDLKEKIDIDQLNEEIERSVKRINELREKIKEIVLEIKEMKKPSP